MKNAKLFFIHPATIKKRKYSDGYSMTAHLHHSQLELMSLKGSTCRPDTCLLSCWLDIHSPGQWSCQCPGGLVTRRLQCSSSQQYRAQWAQTGRWWRSRSRVRRADSQPLCSRRCWGCSSPRHMGTGCPALCRWGSSGRRGRCRWWSLWRSLGRSSLPGTPDRRRLPHWHCYRNNHLLNTTVQKKPIYFQCLNTTLQEETKIQLQNLIMYFFNVNFYDTKNDKCESWVYRISSISSITLNIRSTPIFAKIIIFCASKIRSQFFK